MPTDVAENVTSYFLVRPIMSWLPSPEISTFLFLDDARRRACCTKPWLAVFPAIWFGGDVDIEPGPHEMSWVTSIYPRLLLEPEGGHNSALKLAEEA
jgi:hypothetical protein